jgi:hypothetical protein
MANPTLNWRYVGTLTFVSAINNALDAVYTLGTAVTYADGSARVPGTGSAWTWAREVAAGPVTVAAYGIPPVNALGFNYIIGGTSGASAYTFLTPDSATLANCIVYGMNRSSGAFTTWTSATPFTNASGFSGYWRGTRAFASLGLSDDQETRIDTLVRTETSKFADIYDFSDDVLKALELVSQRLAEILRPQIAQTLPADDETTKPMSAAGGKAVELF